MTPPAITDAGRVATGHGRRLQTPKAPPRARRVSGPVRRQPVERPVERPARRAERPAVKPVRRPRRPLSARLASFARSLPDHRLLHRLVTARSWIPILAVMLAGIVAMQVSLLKLGANTGRLIEKSSTLQSTNEQLRARVGTLADDQRIERLAAGMGMVMPAPTAVSYLDSTTPVTPTAAAGAITAPSPTTFALKQQTAAVTDPTQSSTSGGPATVPVTTTSVPPSATTSSGGASAASTSVSTPAAGTSGVTGAATSSTVAAAQTTHTYSSSASSGSSTGGGASTSASGASVGSPSQTSSSGAPGAAIGG